MAVTPQIEVPAAISEPILSVRPHLVAAQVVKVSPEPIAATTAGTLQRVVVCFAPSSGASAEQQVCASENASARIPVPQPILKGSEKVEILIATLLGVRWAKS